MSPSDLLIDGYNLLHAAGLAQTRYRRGDLQRARQGLLRRLFQLLTPAEISRTAVVFDARHPPPHLPALWYIHGMRVVYARPHGDADIILEQLIAEHSAPRRLTVVSSDHRLHRAAKTRRATAIDSGDFLDFLEERRHAPPTVEIPEPQRGADDKNITAAELAYWMSIFGDVKVSDIAETIKPERSPGKKTSAIEPAPQSPACQQTSANARKPGPQLFSAEWIEELQKWVDQQQ